MRHRFSRLIFPVLFILVIAAGNSHAVSYYYISPSGNDTSGAGTSASPWKTFSKAFSSMAGGDVVIAKNGTYNETISAVPNGSSSAYTVVKAENDGGAIVTGLDIASKSYFQLEGINFVSNVIKQIGGPKDANGNATAPSRHVKILRCSFKGGVPSGNSHNFYFYYSHHLLIEDSFFYGIGGRYTIATQSSSEIILRRLVVRKDAGWDPGTGSDPEAAVSIYNSSNALLQNVIVIDALMTYGDQSGLFLVYNGSTSPHPNDNVSVVGSIILNCQSRGILTVAGVSNSSFTDIVVANIVTGALGTMRGFHNRGDAKVNRMTMVNYPAFSTAAQYGVYSDGSITVSNSIVAGLSGGVAFSGVGPSNSDAWGNSSNNGTVSYSPYTGGLLYLVRTENPSTLRTAGIGANITTRIGTSGAGWGEPGYNTDTGASLWPWPYESRIKADMASVSTRGFAGNSSLTHYIMNFLGNGDPYSGVTPHSVTPPLINMVN